MERNSTGALTITGTTAELTDALVTASKLVVASNAGAAVIFKSGDDPTGAELAAINPKVSGNITLANNAQTFTGSASDLKAAFNGGLQGTQTGNVAISDTEGNIAATTLTDITSETSGTVTAASSGITITEPQQT